MRDYLWCQAWPSGENVKTPRIWVGLTPPPPGTGYFHGLWIWSNTERPPPKLANLTFLPEFISKLTQNPYSSKLANLTPLPPPPPSLFPNSPRIRHTPLPPPTFRNLELFMEDVCVVYFCVEIPLYPRLVWLVLNVVTKLNIVQFDSFHGTRKKIVSSRSVDCGTIKTTPV